MSLTLSSKVQSRSGHDGVNATPTRGELSSEEPPLAVGAAKLTARWGEPRARAALSSLPSGAVC